MQPADDAGLQRRARQLLQVGEVDEAQRVRAVLVGQERDAICIEGNGESVHVELQLLGEDALGATVRGDQHEAAELGSVVAQHEEALAVAREFRVVVEDRLALRRIGDARLGTGLRVHHPDVALGGGDELRHCNALLVFREAEVAPAAAVQSGDHAIDRGLRGIGDVDDRARLPVRIVLVHGLCRVHGDRAVAREPQVRHALALGREGRHVLRREILAIAAEDLIAAFGLREDEILARSRLESPALHCVGIVREGDGRCARLRHQVHLVRRIEAAANEHLALVRVPREHSVRAEFAVRVELLRKLRRNRRHVLEHGVTRSVWAKAGAAAKRAATR